MTGGDSFFGLLSVFWGISGDAGLRFIDVFFRVFGPGLGAVRRTDLRRRVFGVTDVFFDGVDAPE